MRAWLLIAILAAGCTAAFRTQSGGATAPDGVAKGTTNSLYFSDRGGLLTRAGLVALGVLAAAGSIENVQSTSTVHDNFDGTVTVTTRTSGTFNAKSAADAQAILEAAGDPKQNFGGLSGGLEIASTKLGGDTSGWIFDFGWVDAKTYFSRWGIKWSAKFAFGGMTFHDRMKSSYDDESGMIVTSMGDQSYTFVGVVGRFGVTYRPAPHTLLEGFAQIDYNTWFTSNDDGHDGGFNGYPSPWHFGVRATIADYVYAEASYLFSSMDAVHRSVGLEVGLAF